MVYHLPQMQNLCEIVRFQFCGGANSGKSAPYHRENSGITGKSSFQFCGGCRKPENRCAASGTRLFAESEFMDGILLGSNGVGFKA